jgi:calcineurin-like phosphoesterase
MRKQRGICVEIDVATGKSIKIERISILDEELGACA